jgi:hypothetical protein
MASLSKRVATARLRFSRLMSHSTAWRCGAAAYPGQNAGADRRPIRARPRPCRGTRIASSTASNCGLSPAYPAVTISDSGRWPASHARRSFVSARAGAYPCWGLHAATTHIRRRGVAATPAVDRNAVFGLRAAGGRSTRGRGCGCGRGCGAVRQSAGVTSWASDRHPRQHHVLKHGCHAASANPIGGYGRQRAAFRPQRRKQMIRQVLGCVRGGMSGALVLRGDPGAGKTANAREMSGFGELAGLHPMVTLCDALVGSWVIRPGAGCSGWWAVFGVACRG